MIMQDPKYSLNPVMTVGKQIEEAFLVHSKDSKREALQAHAGNAARGKIREPERVYKAYPHEVSGGMGQRIMIAMMMIPEPSIIIADEPTSALDVTVQLQVLAVLDDMISERGMGLIFISHDLNLIASFCDRILIMYGGQVMEECDADKLHAGTASLYARSARLPAAARRSPARACGIAPRSGLAGNARRIAMIDIQRTGRGLRSWQASFHAVRDVSLSVETGQSFGLVGESGSGKTTVLRALAGLLDRVATVSGDMVVAGETLQQQRSKAFRRRVQMVFQDPFGSLHPRHTVDTILSEPARVHRLDRIEQRVVARARGSRPERLVSVSLSAPDFRWPAPAGVGRARADHRSDIVLLDEPTSALDVSVQAEVLNLLMRLKREHGLTYVLVSHNLAVVAHMCESLSVMQNGAIVETMSVQQLREHSSTMPYTQQLLTASLGYDRGAIDAFEEFGQ